MATTACDWIDGELRIDSIAVGDTTRMAVGTELGGRHARARVPLRFSFQAPLAEFARAVERVPHVVAPLRVGGEGRARIVFCASEDTRRTTMPPPPIEISADSLFLRPGAPPMPRDKDEGATPGSLPVYESRRPRRRSRRRGAVRFSHPAITTSGWDD